MKLKRILTGVIGLPIIALILICGSKYIIDVLFAVVAIISMHEYFNAISKKYKPVKWLGYVSAILIAFLHIIMDVSELALMKLVIAIIPLIIAILFIKVILSNMETNFADIAYTLFGIIYVVGFIAFIPLVYGLANGKFLIWYILIAAWGTDTFAYIVGLSIGKHKLTKISPKKSVEGSVGGILGAVLISLIYTAIIPLNISYLYIGIITAVLSILSQLGDLAASSIKRFIDIKDFGNLLPGHGGMLDRIDSMIFMAPFAYFMISILI